MTDCLGPAVKATSQVARRKARDADAYEFQLRSLWPPRALPVFTSIEKPPAASKLSEPKIG